MKPTNEHIHTHKLIHTHSFVGISEKHKAIAFDCIRNQYLDTKRGYVHCAKNTPAASDHLRFDGKTTDSWVVFLAILSIYVPSHFNLITIIQIKIII